MCAVNAYVGVHLRRPDNRSSGGGRPLSSTSSTYALVSIGYNIIFIDNWLQSFEAK